MFTAVKQSTSVNYEDGVANAEKGNPVLLQISD